MVNKEEPKKATWTKKQAALAKHRSLLDTIESKSNAARMAAWNEYQEVLEAIDRASDVE